MRGATALSCLLVVACGPTRAPAESDAGSGGGSGELGPNDLVVQAMQYAPIDLPEKLLADGSSVELWRAPQGGHVMRIGARVVGLGSDIVEVRARLRNPETGALVAEEARTVTMEVVASEPDTMQTDRRSGSQSAHIPACPAYEERDIVDQPYQLEVTVTELYADFSWGYVELSIVPVCAQADPREEELCRCECTGGYTLGRCG